MPVPAGRRGEKTGGHTLMMLAGKSSSFNFSTHKLALFVRPPIPNSTSYCFKYYPNGDILAAGNILYPRQQR
jgi:hypothetical protein